MEFITTYRPYRTKDGYKGHGGFETIPGGYLFTAGIAGGQLTALLPTDDDASLEAEGLHTRGSIKLKLERPGQPAQVLEAREGKM
jgi:hypothetical protein